MIPRRVTAPAGATGATLLEMVVAVAILTMLVGLAAPGFAGWIAEQRLMEEARRLAYGLALARSEAIKRNGRVEICVARSPAGCEARGGWHQGFLTFRDLDADTDRDASEPLVAFEPASPAEVTIVGNAPVAHYVSFTHSGHARKVDGALQMGTFTVCRAGLRALKVVLANSGRARIDRSDAVCP